ncbi:hypothetical protein Fmac_008792 [Flemingia macrophylla]|uniref:E2F/DP family winged-helix DNA-binding domain-containing protein n=1 Tax=Flemingia macrophylla TaxID=520843 RepID=A0ABD1MYF1_9FABA
MALEVLAETPTLKLETLTIRMRLGLDATCFLTLYNKQDVRLIGLDDAASRLGVERRRIYDIVNVLESVGVLARRAKNQYTWKGFSAIPAALQELKDEGFKENPASCDGSNDSSKMSDDEDEEETFPKLDAESQNDKENPDSTAAAKSIKTENRREKSLALLTQNFVKLFICCNFEIITLDEAAKLLLGNAHKIMRTKVRRLYDIANVLSSMNLIEKTHATNTKKPAFRWLGFGGKTSESADTDQNSIIKEPKKRMFGGDLTNIDLKRNKVGLFMDGQNSKVQNEQENISYGAQTGKNNLEKGAKQTTKSYQFGPFAPAAYVPKVGTSENNTVKQVHNWDSLSQVHRPQYQNQVLKDLFSHYMQAWKSWYSEAAGKK